MAWFAVDNRLTRSLRWIYASRAARMGWYGLAELANDLRTAGIIPDAQGRDREIAEASRMRVGDLRACVEAGLARYDETGALRLEGWVNHERGGQVALSEDAPLPPKRTSALTEAQRAQRRAAGLARAAAASRSGGSFAGGRGTPVGQAAAEATSGAPAETASGAPAEPAEATSGAPAERTSGASGAPAEPLAPPLDPTPETQDSKLKTQHVLPSPPSPPVVLPPAAAAAAAPLVITSGEPADDQRRPPADSQRSGPAEPASGAPAEPASGAGYPAGPGTTALTRSPGPIPPGPPRPPGPPGPTPSRPPALTKIRLDHTAVRRALETNDLHALLAGFGCSCTPDLMTEWFRDLEGLSPAMTAVILAWRVQERQPVRMPSGMRQAREMWRSLPADDRRIITASLAPIYGLPPPRGDTPATSPDPAPAA